ncbi:TolC family protein [Fodinibius saliphilus]|uniref:TolC family protein n=1 Tax=Fodinibius saliphilus TaxID=1920650 RepID=UPI001108FA14|nr:TolC family protein [Fodinibius saliphilus]
MFDGTKFGLIFIGLILAVALNVNSQSRVEKVSTAERQDGRGFVVRLHLSKKIDSYQLEQVNFRDIRVKFNSPVRKVDTVDIEEVQYPFRNIDVTYNGESELAVLITLAPTVQLKAEIYQDRFSNDLLVGLTYRRNSFKYSSSDSLVRDMFKTMSSGLLSEKDSTDNSLANVEKIFSQEFQKTSSYDHDRRVLNAQIENEKDKLGVSMASSFSENFGQGLVIGSGISYRRRAQTGIQWDFLGGGLLEHRAKVAQLKNEVKSNQLKEKQSVKEEIYSEQYNAFIELFNKRKINLLQKVRTILEKQTKHARQFYHAKSINWENVLNIMSNLEKTKKQIESYNNYNSLNTISFTEIDPATDLPMLEIRIDQLLQGVRQSAEEKQIYQLQVENIESEHSAWRDVNLDLSVDYTYYDGIGSVLSSGSGTQGDRGYMSAGLQLRLPLPLGVSSNKELIEAKKNRLKYENKQEQYTTRKQVLNHYYDYQHIFRRYLEAVSKLRNTEEKIRKDRTRWKIGDPNFNIPMLWAHINDLFDLKLQIIDIKQSAYLKLLKIYTYVDNRPVTELVDAVGQKELYKKYGFNRSVYVWSETFNKYRRSFLTEYIINNGISKVLLSADETATQSGKVASFISTMHKHDIKVHLLAGVNSLINKDRIDKLNSYVSQIDTLRYDGLHLDVEPHTFQDWDEKMLFYQNNYIDLLQQTKSLLSALNVQLGVSVPVTYDNNFLERIQTYIDDLYVMAYGTDSPEKISESTKNERRLSGIETVLALRTGDFKDRVAFEAFMLEVSERLMFNRISIQDLGGLIELDDEVINYQ